MNPGRPSVNVNARASGTPAKFEATPENVISPRGGPWQPARDDGVGEQEPEDPAEDGGDEADLDAGEVGVADLGWHRSA